MHDDVRSDDDLTYTEPPDEQAARDIVDRLDRASIRRYPQVPAYVRRYVRHEFGPDADDVTGTGTPLAFSNVWTLVRIHPTTRRFYRTPVWAHGPGSPDPAAHHLPFRLVDAHGTCLYDHNPHTWKEWLADHANTDTDTYP